MKKIFAIMIAATLLAACKSSKSLQGSTPEAVKVEQQAPEGKPVEKQSLSAKLDITVETGGQSVNVDGRLQMRTDEVIRIMITPFGLMEVGRLELTPDYLLLVNKMDKEYVKAAYDELDMIKDSRFNFNSLQQQLMKETFVPGKRFDIPFDLSKAGKGKVNLSIVVGKVNTDASFESRTNVSDKYRQVSVQELFNKLMSL